MPQDSDYYMNNNMVWESIKFQELMIMKKMTVLY